MLITNINFLTILSFMIMKKLVLMVVLIGFFFIAYTDGYWIDIDNGCNKTLYVGGDGPNNYTTIQEAINDAEDGYTIFVYNGIYYENVIINKSINLIGQDKNKTIIDGNEKGDVVSIIKDNVRIQGFTIRNSEKEFERAGIVVYNADDVVIENNVIRNNGDQGIRLFSSDYATIRNNIIKDNAFYGIWLYYSKEITIENNVFINNSIVLREGPLVYFIHTIKNNTVNGKPLYYILNKKNCSIESLNAGQIILVNCSNFVINDVTISYASVGIEIAYSKNVSILDCNFSMNKLNGIRLCYSYDNKISFNTLFKNGWSGLSIWYDEGDFIAYNSIYKNEYDNVELLYCKDESIFGNNICSSVYGIGIKKSNAIIHFNNIYKHKCNLIAEDSEVNARWNWWGFMGVLNIVGDVKFFPWLPFPIPLLG